MKKTAVFVSLLMIGYFCFAGKGYAQNPADNPGGQTDSKNISLPGSESRSAKTVSDSKIKSLFSAVKETFQADGCLGDHNDLKPLTETKWLIAYEMQSSIHTDVVIFESLARAIFDSDTIVYLCGQSQEDREGCVFYVNSKEHGPGFALALDGTQLDLYFFTLNQDIIKGYKNSKEQNLVGIRWGGKIGGCDVNGDNKIGLAEVICQLKIISGCDSMNDSANDDCCPSKSISGSRSNLKSNPE